MEEKIEAKKGKRHSMCTMHININKSYSWFWNAYIIMKTHNTVKNWNKCKKIRNRLCLAQKKTILIGLKWINWFVVAVVCFSYLDKVSFMPTNIYRCTQIRFGYCIRVLCVSLLRLKITLEWKRRSTIIFERKKRNNFIVLCISIFIWIVL